MSRVVWTLNDLHWLRRDAAKGMTLSQMADRQGRGVGAADCDLALWALAGRTLEEASNCLNKRVAA